jgi:hypothetical protein
VTDYRPLARQRIKSAKAILGPKCNEASVAGAVWMILVQQERGTRAEQERRNTQSRPTNKKEQMAVDRAARALRHFAAKLRDPDLPKFVRGYFPDEVLKRVPQLEALAKLPLRKPKQSGFSPPGYPLQRRAVMLAVDLAVEHKLSLATTRGGELYRLCAAIYGKKDADLFNVLRFYVRPSRPSQSKTVKPIS